MAEDELTRDDAGAERPNVAEAMAVYSADGQADDETGNDAGAEALRADTGAPHAEDTDAMPHGPA